MTIKILSLLLIMLVLFLVYSLKLQMCKKKKKKFMWFRFYKFITEKNVKINNNAAHPNSCNYCFLSLCVISDVCNDRPVSLCLYVLSLITIGFRTWPKTTQNV